MKCIIFTILACWAMKAEPHPFLGLNVAAGIGQGLGSAVGTGVGLGVGTAVNVGTGAVRLGAGIANGIANGLSSSLGFGVGVANGVANSIANGVNSGLGLGIGVANGIANGIGNGLRPGGIAQMDSKNIEQASNSGADQYNAGASGVHSDGYYKEVEKNFHDRGHNQHNATTVAQSDNSKEQDIGASAAIDEGAHKAGAYNKHGSGAFKYENNYRQGSEQFEVVA